MTRHDRSGFIFAAVFGGLLVAAGIQAVNSRPSTASAATVERRFLPGPKVHTLAVPRGTRVSVRLRTTLSTKTTRVGDRFSAVIAAPVRVGNRVAIPAGAVVSGHVVMAEQPGKSGGRGHLQLALDRMSFGGMTYALDTRSVIYQSKSGAKKDAAMIGGGAVAGGVIGGLLGHGSGSAIKGVVVGGAAGTGASLLTRGPQLTLPAGRTLSVRLDRTVEVRAAEHV